MNEQNKQNGGVKPWERKWAGVIDEKKEQDNGGVISGSLNTVRDLGVSALKGAVEVPNAIIGLGDAVSAALGVGDGGNLRRALANDDGVIGFNPAQAKRMMNEWHSDDYKQAQQDFANADGIAAKTKVALSNPLDIIANTITESVPSMLAGGVAGGVARGALVKAGMSGGKAALAGGAIGEGLMGAGSAAAGIQEETGGTLSQGQGLAALGSGVATGLLGLAGGKMAQKLGVADVDSALTHATSGQALGKVAGEITQNVAPQSVPLAVIKGAIAEGLLEELPQSVSEQLIQNLATGKDWHDDLDGAAVLGVLSGMAMGGGMAGVSAVAENQDIAQNQALAQAQEEVKNQQWQQRLQEMEQFHAQDLAQKQAIENEKKLNQEMALNQHLENLQQEKDLMQKVQDIEQGAGFVQSDVPQAIKPSEKMGLDANAGTLSAAAVQAVDSGVAVLPENVAQSADLPMSQAAGVAAGNGENVAHQAENAVSGSLNNEPVQVEPLMSYRVADEVQENALPPFEIVANREPDYRVSAAMRKNPDKLGNLLGNEKRADGALSPRKRLAAMPKTLQNAFEVLADYHADFTLRRENGLPDVREQYPQRFQAARALVKQHLQDKPQDRDLFDNLNAAALVYRRNVGWAKPLDSKAADVNGVEPKKEQGVNPVPETVEPTVQPVSEPVGAQQAEQVNDMNKAASKSPEQLLPDLIDVQTADGKTKRVRRADWENGDLASLPTYSANGKKTAVKLKRDNVKQNDVSAQPDTPPVNMTGVSDTQQNAVSGSPKAENSAVKIIGKNKDGKDIFEKADGVRYIQNGKFIKQDSVRISPNGNYVATESRDDELKTVEELAQQADNETKPQQTEQNNELERITEPERADERATGSRTQHQVEPVSELAADNAGTLVGMATENGAGNESAGGVEVSNRPSGRADDDGVGRVHGNGHAPTRGAERSGATTSAVATRGLSETLPETSETSNSGSLKTAEHTQEQDFSDKKQLIQAAQQLGKLEIVGLGDKVATEPQQDDGKANSRDVAVDKVVSDEIRQQRLDLAKSHKVNWDGKQSQTAEQQENAPELLDMLPELTHLGWKYEPHYQTGAPEFTLSFLKVFNAKMQQVKNVAFGEHSFREFIQNHDIQGKNNREIAQSIHDEMMNKYAIDGYEFQAVDVQPAAGVLAQEIAPEFPIEASEQTKTQELNVQEKVSVSTNASEQADFAISDDDRIGEGGAKTKFKQNLAAIETLKTLLNENRDATASEQKILAKWVGWGGLANAFRRADGSFNKGWENETQQLESVLTADELAAARESTTTAFYTPPEVIKAMWQAVERMGFKGGRVLEPSVGSGSFIGLMPKGLRQSTAMHGTELDTITGNLAKKLYPKAKIQVMGFEDYAIPDGHFRLAIGNPPFGGWKITDKAKSHLNGLAIHNYFFAKSVDALEDNGVLAMVVTNNFMDASDRNDKARDYIAKNTELLAAVRLPNNAFEKNAGTSVTTDVIFLRKLTADERASGQTVGHDWNGTTMHTDKDGNQVPLNVYFANNPDMMLGEFGAFGGMYGGNTAALVAPKGQNTAKLLNEKLQNLPQNIFRLPEKNEMDLQQGMVKTIPDVKVGSLFIQDGKVFKRLPDELGEKRSEPFADIPDNATAIKRIEGMIGIRDVLADVRQLQLTPNVAEGVLSARRKQLNQVYDDFVKKYGYLNSQTNKNLFDDDPSMPQLLALEENYDKGISRDVAKKTGQTAREPAAQKAAIFSKRTQYPTLEVERVSSAKDGLIESLNSVGRVDIHRIAAKYGKEPSEVIAELGDLVFEDPVHGWHTAEQYLSGNVKAKLAQAKEAAKHFPALMRNVQALEAVQPEDIEAADIVVRLGASWLPESVVSQFLRQVAGLTHWSGKGLAVGYAKPIAEWSLAQDPVFTADAKARFGTARTSIKDIVQAALNGKTVNVYDKQTINGQERAILNQEATDEANAKIDELKRAFDDWIWQDDTRRDELARLYNDLFNTDVQTQYDGSHLKLAGKVDDDVIALRPTQKNAVWRITQNQNTLLDHVVGAGKTFTMVAAAMELRRMGLANKPMIVVPNHLVGQWGKEFAQLYPNANILVAGKKDFEKGRRKRLVARVANGDWDAVIVGHSSFEKVPVDKAFQVEFMQRQIVEISAAIEIMREKEGKRSSSAKDMERRRKSIEAKLERLLESKEKDDDNLNWNELGVDALFVDEAHEFKNLGFVSSMRNVAGLGNPEGSQKAMDLYLKVQQMQQNPDSRVVFATGTPISNSMTEMYTMQRYLDEKRLKQQGLNTFDAWAKNFGEVVTDWELSASGKYKMKSRFAKFVNMPELMQSYLGFADVINRDDINESLKAQGKTLPVPKIKGGKPENVIVPRSDFQAAYIGEPNEKDEYAEGTLVWRSENFKREPKEGEVQDNMLRIVGEARKLALDPRIIDPNAPDFEHSKVNTAAKRIFDIYQKWDKQKGTQLVFSDLSTPKGAAAKEQKRILELQEKADLGDAAAMQELEKYSPDELDGILSANDFDVYNELKRKLVALGMPEKEIAFIHDANTDLQKQELFGKVKSGMVRVLIGSTSKMGAGTNVQNRLVALHHLDAPWRPSDLEQREGRIIRQGNELRDADPDGFEVEILRYATEKTMDAMQWQIIENKAKFIGQVRKGDTKSRVVEDIDGEAANAAQMKAASSGNPLILEEMTLRKQIQDLENDKHRHDKQQHRLKATRNKLNQDIGKAEMRLIELDRLMGVPVAKEFDVKVGKAHFKQGQEKARENAGALILQQMNKGLVREIGTFGEFKLLAGRDDFGFVVKLAHGGAEISLPFETTANVGGVLTRLQNAIDRLPENKQALINQIDENRQSLPKIERQFKDWDKNAELNDLRERHRQVLNELKPKNKTPNPTQNAENGAGDDVALDVALSAARIYPVDVNVQTLVRETQNALRAVLGDENMKRVRVVSRYEIAKLLPENWGLAEIVKEAKKVLGLHQAKTGNVFVVAENFESVDLAVITAWHELGHEKVVLSGRKAWRDVMMKAYDNNAVVRAVADKRIKMSKQYQDKGVAVEEALVEMYAAMKSGRYDEFKNRYKVDFPVVPTRSFLQKVMAALRGVINRVLGKPARFSDAQVIELLGKLDSVDLALRDKRQNSGSLKQANFDLGEDLVDEVVADSGSLKRSQQNPRQQYDEAKAKGKTELTFAQWQQVRTPEFKAWFGDWENDPENSSKVINPRTGEPLVVYHGGTFDVQAEHAIFDKNRQMQNHFESSGGFFFTDQKNSAEYYAGAWKPTPTGRVTETFLNIRKPIPSRVFNSYFDAVDTYDKFHLDIQSALSDETKGLDGVIYKAIDEDGDYDGALYVVTEPNQIKSATDNTGAFDPNNDDIRFDVLDDDTPEQRNLAMNKLIGAVSFSGSLKDLQQRAGGKWVDMLKIGLQGLGRRQIVDIYGKLLPQLKTYDNLVDKFGADGNKTAMQADELVIRWGKLKDKEQLADLMHEATIAQIDADPLKQDGVTGETDLTKADELKAKFEQLSPEAQAVYRQARDDYKRHFDDVQAAMTARLKRMGVKRKDVFDGLEARFMEAMKGVYFPLSRFGQYVVVVRNEHGKPISVSRAETLNEARKLQAQLAQQFPDDTVEKPILSKEYAQSRDGVGRGFLQALRDELNKNADFDMAQFEYMEDVITQLHFQSLPDLSWAKHGIHRKNRAGFSNDARRAYAQSMSAGASYLSRLRYADLLQEQLDKMQEHADGMKNSDNQPIVQRVVDEMVKRHDSMMNPKPNALSTSLTSFGFLWYLGLSPASAIVNLSQTALVAYPIMAAKWGHKKAAAELLKASQQTFTKRKLPSVKMNGWRPELDDTDWNDISGSLNADELVAYNRAVDDGTIDISQAHDLAGIASGEDSGALWRFRGVMRAASYLFHQAERFNRQVTFVAAYRLAKQTGVDSDTAFAQAKKATYDGHFDYATHNRPRFMQGNVARVVFLFKQYSQNMIYTLSRNAYQAAKGDKEARKVFAGLMVAHAAAAGVLGLPMVTTLLAAASWLGSDDDEPWDAEVALRNQLADIFGDKGSEIISKGLSRATPWDISGRVGLDNLIFPNVQDGLEGKRWAESFAAGMAGPVVGLGINFANGSQKMVQGDYLQGLEGFLPVALRNPLKSYRLATDGMKDTSGIVIKDDFNAAELLGQAAGFSAADARLAQEAKSAIYQADKRLAARRAELLAMFAKAKMQGDNDAMSKAREQIQRFNEKNPSRKITVPQMLQSVRNRQKRIDEAKNGIYLSQNRSDARSAGAFGTDD